MFDQDGDGRLPSLPEESWRQMPAYKLLIGLGSVAAAWSAVGYVMNSAATGFGLLMSIGMA